jgi:hypothetical protein
MLLLVAIAMWLVGDFVLAAVAFVLAGPTGTRGSVQGGEHVGDEVSSGLV